MRSLARRSSRGLGQAVRGSPTAACVTPRGDPERAFLGRASSLVPGHSVAQTGGRSWSGFTGESPRRWSDPPN
jgi:hypothetical protein